MLPAQVSGATVNPYKAKTYNPGQPLFTGGAGGPAGLGPGYNTFGQSIAPTTTTSTSAPSGSSNSGGIFDFSKYQDMINNDPILKQLQLIYGAGGSSQIANQGQRKLGIDNALIADADPTYLSELRSGQFGDAIDQTTLDAMHAANSSGVGGYARRNQAYQDAQKGWVDHLAANGILRSGETGYQLGREGLKFNQNEYDAKNALLNLLANVQKDYLSSEGSRNQSLQQALMDAASRELQIYQGQLATSPGGPGATQYSLPSGPSQVNYSPGGSWGNTAASTASNQQQQDLINYRINQLNAGYPVWQGF